MKRLEKDFLLHATKLTKKMSDLSNGKEYYNFHLKRKKKAKSVKLWNVIAYQLKAIENLNIVDIIIKHPKTLHKLSKTIRQAEKVSQVVSCKSSNIPLYSKTKKCKFSERKNCKNNKTTTCF